MRGLSIDARYRVVKNLVTNPSLEVNGDNWSFNSGGSGSGRSSDWAAVGSWSAMVLSRDTTGDNYAACGGDTGALRLGMQPGHTYTASASWRIPVDLIGTTTRGVIIRFYYRIASGPYINMDSPPVAGLSGSGRASLTFTIPADATEALLRLYNGYQKPVGSPVPNAVYWDAVMLTEGPTLYDYADGNSPNWAWDSTPGASTSRGRVFVP